MFCWSQLNFTGITDDRRQVGKGKRAEIIIEAKVKEVERDHNCANASERKREKERVEGIRERVAQRDG